VRRQFTAGSRVDIRMILGPELYTISVIASRRTEKTINRLQQHFNFFVWWSPFTFFALTLPPPNVFHKRFETLVRFTWHVFVRNTAASSMSNKVG
jgi:hypothetical protein